MTSSIPPSAGRTSSPSGDGTVASVVENGAATERARRAPADAPTTHITSVPGTGKPVGSPADNPTIALPAAPSVRPPRREVEQTLDTEPIQPAEPELPERPAEEHILSARRQRVAWHHTGTGPIPVMPGSKTSHRWRKIFGRTAGKTWNDSIFGWSAQAGFWCALSTAPLLLALLGLAGFVSNWFGPETLPAVENQVLSVMNTVFSPDVVNGLLKDNVHNLLTRGQADLVSVGFVISLWAGSSAMSAFVEAITIAYGQHEVRHPAVERFFALGLYLIALLFGIVLLPLAAIGPTTLVSLFPPEWQQTASTVVEIGYFPALGISIVLLLTTLYKVAPKHKHPWRRGIPGAVLAAVIFLITSHGLRIYVSYVTSHGLSYGALATPIVFLLFYYFVSMAIIVGAQFNNATLEYYPPRRTKAQLRKWRRLDAVTPGTPSGKDESSRREAQPLPGGNDL